MYLVDNHSHLPQVQHLASASFAAGHLNPETTWTMGRRTRHFKVNLLRAPKHAPPAPAPAPAPATAPNDSLLALDGCTLKAGRHNGESQQLRVDARPSKPVTAHPIHGHGWLANPSNIDPRGHFVARTRPSCSHP
ncbi:uncharacterized protein UV8b_07298 [Ustilaginoidea virens]|uniref:Uncharacterized protein n=1 Tax=Ustilaginoidea virens TaxID=1159556 RepID=A0A8E5MKE6_USTVR|nr:uncharacterized protein UV8b_07298 [Ustilaginoidea virens]QUC23057.1 hypothetical protein UV8b_07298 [Ustilaginoidea virens]